MLRSILVGAAAALIAVSSATPVLAPDALEARVAELEAKLKALDIDEKVEAKSELPVKKEGRRGAFLLTSPSFTLSSGGSNRAGNS